MSATNFPDCWAPVITEHSEECPGPLSGDTLLAVVQRTGHLFPKEAFEGSIPSGETFRELSYWIEGPLQRGQPLTASRKSTVQGAGLVGATWPNTPAETCLSARAGMGRRKLLVHGVLADVPYGVGLRAESTNPGARWVDVSKASMPTPTLLSTGAAPGFPACSIGTMPIRGIKALASRSQRSDAPAVMRASNPEPLREERRSWTQITLEAITDRAQPRPLVLSTGKKRTAPIAGPSIPC